MLWISNLKNYFLAGLALSLLMTLVLLNRAWSEVAEKTAVIDSMHREAQAYKEKSETTSKEIGDAFTTLVEQIQTKDTALNAARTRFGVCNVARGIGANSVFRNNDADGEADSTEAVDGLRTEERVAIDKEHIDDYAACIGFVKLTKEWVVTNDLPISKE